MEKFSRAMFLVVMLCVPHFANQVLSGINQQVHQYFYFVCAIMTSVTRSLPTVLWEMSALLSLMTLSAAGGQYCCWCAWLNALKWFLPLTRTGQWEFNDANNLAWAYRRLLVSILFMQIITALNIVSDLFIFLSGELWTKPRHFGTRIFNPSWRIFRKVDIVAVTYTQIQ